MAYPLITSRVIAVFQQQLVQALYFGWSRVPPINFVEVGTVNYNSTGHHLAHYQSLRGTLINVAPRDGNSPPTFRPHLTAMFVEDYLENKPFIIVSCDPSSVVIVWQSTKGCETHPWWWGGGPRWSDVYDLWWPWPNSWNLPGPPPLHCWISSSHSQLKYVIWFVIIITCMCC